MVNTKAINWMWRLRSLRLWAKRHRKVHLDNNTSSSHVHTCHPNDVAQYGLPARSHRCIFLALGLTASPCHPFYGTGLYLGQQREASVVLERNMKCIDWSGRNVNNVKSVYRSYLLSRKAAECLEQSRHYAWYPSRRFWKAGEVHSEL